MKALNLTLSMATLAALIIVFAVGVHCSAPPSAKQAMALQSWKHQSAKQVALGRNPTGKQRTLVVQIRSDQPVPLVLQGRPNHAGSHAHIHHAHGHHVHHIRGPRPIKLTAPVYMKSSGVGGKSPVRKPLKIKLVNGFSSKVKSKPSTAYESPFKYETPSTLSQLTGEVQKLPLETHASFAHENFAAIHTIPAPNLSLHDNHLHPEESYLPPSTPKPQPYHQYTSNNHNQYQVTEDETNDQTILDPLSGSQKLFAPDPDPSLPTSKIRPATEHHSTPSNGKPLPADVQSNFVPAAAAAQPLVQIVSGQPSALGQAVPEIYPVQYSQPFVAVQPAAIPIYNPTYLVTQSNNLYTQHKQQLFKPASVLEAGYVNADLTQEVASDGQILQAAKDAHHNIHPVLDSAPQFAALIAAPALSEEAAAAATAASYETSPFRLPNVAAASGGPEGGFIVSNFYSNPHDSSQLLQAYAEEEARRQQVETQQAALELQLQQQQHQQLQELQQQHQQQQQLQQLQELQQHEFHQQQLLQQQIQEQQQQHQQQHQQQLQQQQHLQQLQQQQEEQQYAQLLELQQQQQQQQQQQYQQQQYQHSHATQHADPAASAFAEHERLVQQQLGETPLRIFVPDDDTARLQKRSDNVKRGSVQDARVQDSIDRSDARNSFEVYSSVEVSNGDAQQNVHYDEDDEDEQDID